MKISKYSTQDGILQQVGSFSISTPKSLADTFSSTLKKNNYEFNFLNVKSKRVLDWGSNFGIFAQWCFENDATSVISIEPNIKYAKYLRRNTYFLQVKNKYLAIEGDLNTKNTSSNFSNRKSKINNQIKSTNDFLNFLNTYNPEIIKIENLNDPLLKLERISDYINKNKPQIAIKTSIEPKLFKNSLPEGYICEQAVKIDDSTQILNCIHSSLKNLHNKVNLKDNVSDSFPLINSSKENSTNKDTIAFSIYQWDNTKYTSQCVKSLLNALDEKESKIIIFDNNSKNTQDQVKLFCNFINDKRVIFISSKSRLSYVDGFNASAKFAQLLDSKFVYFLSNDTYDFSKGIDTATIKAFQDPKVAMVGHRVFDCDGVVRHDSCKVKSGISFPTPTEGYALRISHFNLVGGFNSTLKIYREDIDLINRIHSFGLRIVLDLSKSYVHIAGCSTGKLIFIPIFYRVRNFIWFDNLNNLLDIAKILLSTFKYTQYRIKSYHGKFPKIIATIMMNLLFLYAIFCGSILRIIKPSPYKKSFPYKLTNS